MVERMSTYEDAIDAYDIDVEMGRTHEQALRFALQEHGVSRQLIEHYLREIGDASVRQPMFGKAVVDFVTSWTVHAEQWRLRGHVWTYNLSSGKSSKFVLDHEMVADDLMFSFTRRFPKHDLFQLRDGISQVIEIVMLVNLHMFVSEDQS